MMFLGNVCGYTKKTPTAGHAQTFDIGSYQMLSRNAILCRSIPGNVSPRTDVDGTDTINRAPVPPRSFSFNFWQPINCPPSFVLLFVRKTKRGVYCTKRHAMPFYWDILRNGLMRATTVSVGSGWPSHETLSRRGPLCGQPSRWPTWEIVSICYDKEFVSLLSSKVV